MTEPLTHQIVDPLALTSTERARFTDELYRAHDRIFAGVDRATFAAYVVDSPAARTRIQVFRSGEQIVGYAAFHAFESTAGGRPALVLRAEVGLLPEYRRGTRMGWFLARECIHCILRSPGRSVYGLSCATNPATYRTLAKHTDQVWPHWQQPTPDDVQQLMTELAEQFQLRSVDDDRPGVYHVGWQTRQSEDEALGWKNCQHPASRLYIDRNPDYAEGQGLLVLVPLTRLGLVRTCMRLIETKLRRRFGLRRRLGLTPAMTPMQQLENG